jgi:acetyl esterase/lipase
MAMTGTKTYETAIYATHGSADLALDIFPPTAGSRRCAVLVFHGGAWRRGAKEFVHDRAAALAAAGFTALAVQYRLLDVAPWPGALEDAVAALGWARANAARLGVDPGRVVAQGHSAGAHIALMTGTLDRAERPAAIVAYYPPIGFYLAPPPAGDPTAGPAERPPSQFDELGRVPGWMLLPREATQAEVDAASPITLADADFPPTIIQHGTADTALSTRSSIALHDRLTDLGVPAELHIYAGRDHEFDRAPSMTAVTTAVSASFLARTVTDREASEAEAAEFPFPPRS